MRRFTLVIALALLLAASAMAQAIDVYMYIDTAPNAYGSANFATWKATTFAAVANGTFTNMASGNYSGTTYYDPLEAIVYSGGDLGKRLHWIYWVPGETISSLTGKFKAKEVFDWGGVDYTIDDSNNSVVNTADNGWFTPGSWINYDSNGDGNTDGVIGTFGDAWWPAYTPDAIQDTVDEVYAYQTFWSGIVSYQDADGAWKTVEMRGNVAAPEPMSIILGIMGLGSVVGFRKFRK